MLRHRPQKVAVPELQLRQILQETPTRCFQAHEINKILTNYEKFELRNSPPDRPVAGSTFLYNRVSNKSFRKDGYSWKKKKDGLTVPEKVEQLKIDGVAVIRHLGKDHRGGRQRTYERVIVRTILKDKLYNWILLELDGDGLGPKAFDDEGQAVIHLVAAVGFGWAIAPNGSCWCRVEKSLPVEVEKSLSVEAHRGDKLSRVDKKKQQVPKKGLAPSSLEEDNVQPNEELKCYCSPSP
ncbi:calmodulin-binding transcription activator 3-like protein isoform X1 [Tanacetum coccineum]